MGRGELGIYGHDTGISRGPGLFSLFPHVLVIMTTYLEASALHKLLRRNIILGRTQSDSGVITLEKQAHM